MSKQIKISAQPKPDKVLLRTCKSVSTCYCTFTQYIFTGYCPTQYSYCTFTPYKARHHPTPGEYPLSYTNKILRQALCCPPPYSKDYIFVLNLHHRLDYDFVSRLASDSANRPRKPTSTTKSDLAPKGYQSQLWNCDSIKSGFLHIDLNYFIGSRRFRSWSTTLNNQYLTRHR